MEKAKRFHSAGNWDEEAMRQMPEESVEAHGVSLSAFNSLYPAGTAIRVALVHGGCIDGRFLSAHAYGVHMRNDFFDGRDHHENPMFVPWMNMQYLEVMDD